MQAGDGERKAVPAALTVSAFEAMFAQSGSGLIVVAPSGRILHVNPAARQCLGLPRSEAAAVKALRDAATPPFPHLRRMLDWVLTTGRPILERVLCRPAEDPQAMGYWECSLVPVSSSPDPEAGVLIVVRDIGVRKRLERRLRESQSRLLAALAASKAGTFGKYLRLGRVDADTAFRRLWAFPPNGPLSVAAINARIHREDRARVAAALARADAEGGGFELEYRMAHPDGTTRWLAETGHVQGHGDQRRLIGACVDITRHKRAEQTLREADRRKDEFLAMLAHELRNPLAPMRSVVDALALQRDELPETARWGLGVIDRQIAQLTRLVDDLLDVGRISSGRIRLRTERLDLRTVVEAAADNVRVRAEAGQLAFEVSLPRTPIVIQGDPARLLQCIDNLLDNAVKFTQPGGSVSISLRRLDGRAVLQVKDTGLGIDPAFLPEVFELFRQADQSLARTHGGLGIGLTVVRRLVELHGGSVRAESPGTGQGARFLIELPLIGGA